jgi:hypothetical protein
MKSSMTLRIAIAGMLWAGLQACGGSSNPPLPATHSISGTVSGAVTAGATVALAGASSATATTGAGGAYSFSGLQDGAYTLTPSLSGYTFSPPSTQVTVSGRDVAAINFASAAVLAAPTGVTAAPGNAAATVSWTAAAGATSYNVYFGTSPSLTTSNTKVSVLAPPALVTGLTNGTAVYFAVSSVGATGETALSAVPCAVPTTANTAGLTLHDPLCGASIDGTRWQSPGEFSTSVSGGAARLRVSASNQESRTVRNLQYATVANVVTGHRVTSLAADINVPAATAARTGNAEIRASVRIFYSPPENRLLFPGGSLNLVLVEAGLMDSGSGLKAFRSISHCDNASCTSVSKQGLVFTDPASFEALDADAIKLGESADYDVAYRVTARLEAGVFHWSITGGKFGALGVTGSAIPGLYLIATPGWQPHSLVDGFFGAQLSVRTLDNSAAGGGSGTVAATFRNVWAGFDDAAPTLFDDFSGTGSNSGSELSAAKWFAPGANGISMSGGGAAVHASVSAAGANPTSTAAGLTLANPASINTLQADVTVTSVIVGAALGATNNAFLQGTFYNTGTQGTTAPDINQPYSAVGDVLASVFLEAATNDIVFSLQRLETANGAGPTTQLARFIVPAATVDTSVHTLLIRWDPAAHTFTFGVDGLTHAIDPTVTGPDITVAAPVSGAANWPVKRIFASVAVPPTGASGNTSVRVNNVFTAP